MTVLDDQIAALSGPALVVLAAAIQQAGSIEAAIAERQQALQAAVARHEDLKLQLEATNADLIAARAAQATEIVAHQALIVNMMTDAQQQAQAIVSSASVLVASRPDVPSQINLSVGMS